MLFESLRIKAELPLPWTVMGYFTIISKYCLGRAIANISEEAAARQRLADLCEVLIDSLDESDSSFLAKLSALSGIGRAAPDIFAEHAMSPVSFVCQVTTCSGV